MIVHKSVSLLHVTLFILCGISWSSSWYSSDIGRHRTWCTWYEIDPCIAPLCSAYGYWWPQGNGPHHRNVHPYRAAFGQPSERKRSGGGGGGGREATCGHRHVTDYTIFYGRPLWTASNLIAWHCWQSYYISKFKMQTFLYFLPALVPISTITSGRPYTKTKHNIKS